MGLGMSMLRDASTVLSSPRTAATATMSLRRYAHADREVSSTETDLPVSPVLLASCQADIKAQIQIPNSCLGQLRK